MESVYLETTVVGTIASRDHPDPIILARQSVTRRWWRNASIRYHLYISDLVIVECSVGDPTAAAERQQVIGEIDVLSPLDEAESLVESLLDGNAVPKTEPRDAAHVALAAVHGIDFLVTWNFKHILNPHTQHLIDAIIRSAGFIPPTICTPEQLLEASDGS